MCNENLGGNTMGSKFINLVRPQYCKIPIRITIYSEEITEDGAPAPNIEVEAKCIYQSVAKTKTSSSDGKETHIVEITGKAYIHGDVAPEIPEITDGEAIIFGEKRKISRGMKARNIDGTVNYTCLELI